MVCCSTQKAHKVVFSSRLRAMETEVCMNYSCKNNIAHEWKKGWPLRSGGFARLCDNCGSAYANSTFCEQFHQHQSGWINCNHCNKSIHCGCIVSRSLFEHLDFGGIGCVTCVQASQLPLICDTENLNVSIRSIQNNANDLLTEHIDGSLLVDGAGKGNMQLCRSVEASEPRCRLQAEKDSINSCISPHKLEDKIFSNVMKSASRSSTFPTLESISPMWETRSMHTAHSLTNISLGPSLGNSIMPSTLESVEGSLEGKSLSSPFHQGFPVLSKSLTNDGIIMNLEPNKGVISQERIARPPADGRGKNLLLSRYWPKITDQELEQLSGDLKSIVVPLFEKVLSASDAGRIGRLVLPKSCAEAYFPPISQPEGLSMQIQDVKGNEWIFQFRFWPNNNSRMYVLEGVTPCMQTMQLNAGDIVTFSRIDPGGKFVMGFRKALGSIDTQDTSSSTHSNGLSTKETTSSGTTANFHSGSSYHDLLQTMKVNDKTYLNGCSQHLRSGVRTTDYLQLENNDMVNDDLLQQPISPPEKTSQNIGFKRLLRHDEDAMELQMTWEEALDMLSPPPGVEPNIETIEDQEFEEYDAPPVFGKRTLINENLSGSLSSAFKELVNITVTSKDLIQEEEPSRLNVLASAAILDDYLDPANSTVRATSKHPRHRVGCTCIVCVQPSSGKGKHKPTCMCLACTTAKRRFNTIMKRKRKRRSVVHQSPKGDTDGASRDGTSLLEGGLNKGSLEVDEPGARQLDLNCHPSQEDMLVDV